MFIEMQTFAFFVFESSNSRCYDLANKAVVQ